MFNKNYFNSSVGIDLLRSDLASTIIKSVCYYSGHLNGTVTVYKNQYIYKLIKNIKKTSSPYYSDHPDECDYCKYYLYSLVKDPAFACYYINNYDVDIKLKRVVIETFLNYFDLEMDFDYDYNFSSFFTCDIYEAILAAVFSKNYTSHSVLTLYNIINDHKIEHHHNNNDSDVVIDSYESLKNYSNLCRMLDSDPSVHDCGIDNDDINIISKTCDHYGWTFAVQTCDGLAVRYKKHCGLTDWSTFCDICDLAEYDDETDEYIFDEYFWDCAIDYIKECLNIDNKVILLTSQYFDNNEAAA